MANADDTPQGAGQIDVFQCAQSRTLPSRLSERQIFLLWFPDCFVKGATAERRLECSTAVKLFKKAFPSNQNVEPLNSHRLRTVVRMGSWVNQQPTSPQLKRAARPAAAKQPIETFDRADILSWLKLTNYWPLPGSCRLANWWPEKVAANTSETKMKQRHNARNELLEEMDKQDPNCLSTWSQLWQCEPLKSHLHACGFTTCEAFKKNLMPDRPRKNNKGGRPKKPGK
jgi:hypothetical protein